MTIAAPHVEEETQRAWAEYLWSLRGLEGPAYAEAEPLAWERLQETLAGLAAGEPTQTDDALG